MYGQYRNSGIGRLYDYAQALRWFEDTKPIKGSGRNAGIKPLGHRDRPHFQILKLTDGSVACRCYNTDVVVFDPDGTVHIKTGGYNSQTTSNFIYDVLGLNTQIVNKSVVVSVDGGGYRVPNVKGGLAIKRVDGYYKACSAIPDTVYRIDRKRMKELRDMVNPYRVFLTGMLKVHDPVFEKEELVEALDAMGYKTDGNWTLEIRHWREDAEHILPRLKCFVETISQEDKDGNWYRASLQLIWSNVAYLDKFRPRQNEVMQHLEDILIATHPEALLVSQCELGIVKRNRYDKFKPYKELSA